MATFQVIFYNTYCLDILIRAGGLVYVRDAAISLFDQRKVLAEVFPMKVKTLLILKIFLQYV